MSRDSSRQLTSDDHADQRQQRRANRQTYRSAQAKRIDSQTKPEEENRAEEIAKRHDESFETRAVLSLAKNQSQQQRANRFRDHVNQRQRQHKAQASPVVRRTVMSVSVWTDGTVVVMGFRRRSHRHRIMPVKTANYKAVRPDAL